MNADDRRRMQCHAQWRKCKLTTWMAGDRETPDFGLPYKMGVTWMTPSGEPAGEDTANGWLTVEDYYQLVVFHVSNHRCREIDYDA